MTVGALLQSRISLITLLRSCCVEELVLCDNHLTGTVPSEFGLLTDLSKCCCLFDCRDRVNLPLPASRFIVILLCSFPVSQPKQVGGNDSIRDGFFDRVM